MKALILILATAIPAADPASAPSEIESVAAVAPRRFVAINDDLQAALRAEATAASDTARAAAIHKMSDLYTEIRRDSRLETSDTLKSYKAKLWSRLTRVKADLQRQLDRQAKQAAGNSQLDPAAVQQAAESLASQMSLMNYTLGGPGNVFSHASGAMGGRPVNDYGQDLIDLIERTIRPDFWDTNGGPGSMFYYQPLMALVVSATSEVHGDVGSVLDALRRAGM